MAWFINNWDIKIADYESLFDRLLFGKPEIMEKYESIVDDLIKQYKVLLDTKEVYYRCEMFGVDTYTFEGGQEYYGYLLEAKLSLKEYKYNVRQGRTWLHRFVLVMDKDQALDIAVINHNKYRKSAQIIPFPRDKRKPREFFLKEPK